MNAFRILTCEKWRLGTAAAAASTSLAVYLYHLPNTEEEKFQDPVPPQTFSLQAKEKNAILLPQLFPFLSTSLETTTSTAKPANISKFGTILRMANASTHSPLISRYDINFLRPAGQGAFGTVYLARNKKTSTPYACKKISRRYTNVLQFRREMDALLQISANGGHPNICSLKEHFQEGDYYYLILDYVGGGEMFDHFQYNGAYSEADAARLVREVACALAFLHGIGVVHRDLKPENLMLSSRKSSDAVIKLVDFGSATVSEEVTGIREDEEKTEHAVTPAYSPPEALTQETKWMSEPSFDMWSLGVIVYIMLTGVHPFDSHGDADDEEIRQRILNHDVKKLLNSKLTKHFSPSAKQLISSLLDPDFSKRPTAHQLLDHPWVNGKTVSHEIIPELSRKLKKFRAFKSRLEAQVFSNMVEWSEDRPENIVATKTSLMERAFQSYDTKRRGYLTAKDLEDDTKTKHATNDKLDLTVFSNLLSDNMKNRYYAKNSTIYNEGEKGHSMYFINSGNVSVTTSDGVDNRRTQGDFFGEGALLNPRQTRSATIKCLTPVHAIEISREYFEKYLSENDSGVMTLLKEKDKARKRQRAKMILKLQKNLHLREFEDGEFLFKSGVEDKRSLYLLESGKVDLSVPNSQSKHEWVFSAIAGDCIGEQSLVLNRCRNASAVCVDPNGCKAYEMKAIDFYKLMDGNPHLKKSLRDICLRRELKKALVKVRRRWRQMELEKSPSSKHTKEYSLEETLIKIFSDATAAPISREKMKRGKKIKKKKSGAREEPYLTHEELCSILMNLDDGFDKDHVMEVIQTMYLSQEGKINFEEFKRLFVLNLSKDHWEGAK